MIGAVSVFPLRRYDVNLDKATVYLSTDASYFKSIPVTSSQFISIECYSSIYRMSGFPNRALLLILWIKIYDSSFSSCLLQVIPI